MTRPLATVLVALVLSALAWGCGERRGGGAGSEAPATLVLRDGPVFTADGAHPWARAVAVRDGEIVYVGENEGVDRFVDAHTQVIDLRGRMLLPGFVDGRIHPLSGAVLERGADLHFDSAEQILAAVSAWAEAHPGAAVVRGFGLRYGAFPAEGPRKQDLDAILPQRPAVLLAVDGRGAWVNSLALERADITPETLDPAPGSSFFQRDPQTGEPTGFVVGRQAIALLLAAVDPQDVGAAAEDVGGWLPRLAGAGITSVFDAGDLGLTEEQVLGLYEGLEREGKLPFRVVGSTPWSDPAVDPLPAVRQLRERYRSGLVSAPILQVELDGGDAQHTAYMLEPYTDRPDTRGAPQIPPDVLGRVVRDADAEGIDVTCRCYGDAAVRTMLDALEAAEKANGPRERRPSLAPGVLVDPDDVARFGPLGATALVAMQWAVADPAWSHGMKTRWGGDRAERVYTVREILGAGGGLGFGSDWPDARYASSWRPLDAVEVALTRQTPGEPTAPIVPPIEDRLALEQALSAATLGAARAIGLDDRTGSIQVGKRADLVVVDPDLFGMDPHEIHTAKVVLTLMDGRVTYREGG